MLLASELVAIELVTIELAASGLDVAKSAQVKVLVTTVRAKIRELVMLNFFPLPAPTEQDKSSR